MAMAMDVISSSTSTSASSCDVYLSNRHKLFSGLDATAQAVALKAAAAVANSNTNSNSNNKDDDSSGVNSESILVKKEETKAFWEGKMQPLDDSYPPPSSATGARNNNYNNNRNNKQFDQQTVTTMVPAPALSPPPGFDNGFHDETDHQQSSLSNDDFTEVASITVVGSGGSATPEPHNQRYVFGDEEEDDEDEEEDEEEEEDLRTPAAVVREKPIVKEVRQVRHKTDYFDDDLVDDDDDDEDDLPVSVTSSRSSGGNNPTETLIEREIRLQREREEAVLRERQQAIEMIEANRKTTVQNNKKEAPMCFKPAQTPVVINEVAPVARPSSSTSSNGSKKSRSDPTPPLPKKQTTETISSAEIRIAEEIRELKRREEELRKLRGGGGGGGEDLPSFTPSAATDDEGLYSDAERDVSSSEANSSRVESPEAGVMMLQSDYSKFPHQRTQSMDSMSSGHSSGDHGHSNNNNNNNNKTLKATTTTTTTTTRGKSVVMPLEDEAEQEDDTPAYRRVSKETPIEREIRLGREREEALRKEKGLQPLWTSSTNKQNEKENRKGQRVGGGNGSGGGNDDKRDVQHRYATSIIQKEIDETSEREIELVRHGKIQTTSIQRADSKVARLGDYTSKRMKPKTKEEIEIVSPSSTVTTKQNDAATTIEKRPVAAVETKKTKEESRNQKVNNKTTTYSSSNGNGNRGFGNSSSMAPPNNNSSTSSSTVAASAVPATTPATWRTFSNPQGGQRGLMEKFILSRGRINSPTAFTGPATPYVITPGSSAGDLVGVSYQSKVSTSKPNKRFAPQPAAAAAAAASSSTTAPPMQIVTTTAAPSAGLKDVGRDTEAFSPVEKMAPPRRHYATTEEKIQQEFREMQKREEELRLNRSKMFAKSQPNLLTCLDGEDADVDVQLNGDFEHSNRGNGQIRSAHSISDLLADEPQSLERDGTNQNSSTTVKGARRKSALIAQWESRIQQDF